MKRQALDNAAKDYWTSYFGEYGKAWVREIPRRIKAAAQKKTAQLETQTVEPTVVPAGYTVTTDGGLDLEGAMRDAGGTRLFSASFDADGNIKDFRTFGDK